MLLETVKYRKGMVYLEFINPRKTASNMIAEFCTNIKHSLWENIVKPDIHWTDLVKSFWHCSKSYDICLQRKCQFICSRLIKDLPYHNHFLLDSLRSEPLRDKIYPTIFADREGFDKLLHSNTSKPTMPVSMVSKRSQNPIALPRIRVGSLESSYAVYFQMVYTESNKCWWHLHFHQTKTRDMSIPLQFTQTYAFLLNKSWLFSNIHRPVGVSNKPVWKQRLFWVLAILGVFWVVPLQRMQEFLSPWMHSWRLSVWPTLFL